MRRSAFVLVLLSLLALAPAADAASRLVIKGRGFGHGIGMSQYGAYGFAQHGYSYQQILEHYYSDTSLVAVSPAPTVRVLLQSGRRAVVSGAVAADDRSLDPAKTYSARAAGSRVALYSPTGRRLGTYDAPLRLAAAPDGSVRLRGPAANGLSNGRYRGAIEVRPSGGRVLAINAVGLEDYIRGVVSAESPSSWPAAQLQAQATVARTYAVTTNVGTTTDGIDQYADTRSQMYRGVAAEYASTDGAVRATRGKVVAYQGQPVATFYFSTSGGETENIENVWPGSQPAPYLRGVEDPYDKIAPRHRWKIGPLTRRQVGARFGSLCSGSFRALKVRKRGVSPRIVAADVVGSKGSRRVTGTNLRQALRANDNWMSFKRVTTNATRSTSTRKAGLAALVFGGGRGIVGSVDPAKPGGKLIVEKRDRRGRWHRAAVGTTGAAGRYRVALDRPDTYRVKSGGAAGPAVRVR